MAGTHSFISQSFSLTMNILLHDLEVPTANREISRKASCIRVLLHGMDWIMLLNVANCNSITCFKQLYQP